MACLALAALAPALAAADLPAFTPEQMGGTLYRNMTSEPQNLNPLTGKDLYERIVNDYVFEALTERDLDTGELKGLLAERWEVSEDGRTVTFHLRPEARFSDGHPVTAEDVVFSYEAVTNPKIDARSMASYFSDCESCEALGPHTVRYRWKQPYFKTAEVSGGMAPVLPRHLYEENVRSEEKGVRFNDLVQGFVGSGPYVFDSWTTGQEIILRRNDRYWGKPRAFDRVVFRLILEEQASVQAFLSGDLHAVSLSPEWWIKLAARPDRGKAFRMYRYGTPANGYSFIGWNNATYETVTGADGEPERVARPHPIFGEPRVRRAMTHLIDRKRLLQYIYQGMGQVATGPFWPEGPQAAPDVEPLPYDRAKAMALLAEAGWKDRDADGWLEDPEGNRFEYEWTIPSGNQVAQDLARILKEEFRRAGIDVQISFVEWSVFVLKLDQRDFDAVILAWGGGGVESDPYQIWHSDQIANQGHNFISFRNARADELIMRARAELDADVRNALYHEFHRLLHREQPYTFFIARESRMAVRAEVRNTIVHKLGMEPEEWWIPPSKRREAGEAAP